MPGQTIGIVGESGCGKSTTANVMCGLQAPTSGKVYFKGKDVTKRTAEDRRHMGRVISVVFQNPATALNPRMVVREQLLDPMRVHNLGTEAEQEKRVKELLELTGLPSSAAEVLPGQLSGGQRQRVAIARALSLNPDAIIADEPTSALDVSVRAQILNLLTDLKKELGLAMVFISHDIQTVRYISDDIIVRMAARSSSRRGQAGLPAPSGPLHQDAARRCAVAAASQARRVASLFPSRCARFPCRAHLRCDFERLGSRAMPSAQELQQQFGEYRGAMPRPSDFDLFWKDRMAEADAIELDYAIEAASVADSATCRFFDLWYTGMCGARLHAKYLKPVSEEPMPLVLQFHGYPGASRSWFEQASFAGMGMALIALDCPGQGGPSEDIGGFEGTTVAGHIVAGIDGDPASLYYVRLHQDIRILCRIVRELEGIDLARVFVNGASQGRRFGYCDLRAQ